MAVCKVSCKCQCNMPGCGCHLRDHPFVAHRVETDPDLEFQQLTKEQQ